MRNLQFTTQTINTVGYSEFNRFVASVYGHRFEIVADQELSNDSQATFTAKKEALDEYDQERIDEFAATGKYSYLTHTIFTDLANRDLIPEGEYLVEVCW
jgi:hypothetical protein